MENLFQITHAILWHPTELTDFYRCSKVSKYENFSTNSTNVYKVSQTKVWAHLVVDRVLANFWQKFYKFRCQGKKLTKIIIYLLHSQNRLLDAKISEISRTYVKL